MQYRVTLIKGDGIGPEVTDATCRVLAAAGAPIEWEETPGGALAVEQYGVPMPKETLDSVRRNRLGLKGPLMTPKGKGFRSANVTLRQELDLYVGYRPVKTLPGIVTPYKNVDLVTLRENTEDLYAGIEHEVTPGTVLTLKVSTRKAAARIASTGHSRTCGTPVVGPSTAAPRPRSSPWQTGPFSTPSGRSAPSIRTSRSETSRSTTSPSNWRLTRPASTCCCSRTSTATSFPTSLRGSWADSEWFRAPTSATRSRSSKRSTAPPRTSRARDSRTRWPFRLGAAHA